MKPVFLFCVILLFQTEDATGQAGGISSKLDFGSSESTTAANNYDSTLSTSLVKALVRLRQTSGPGKTIVSSNFDQSPFSLAAIAPLVYTSDNKNDFSSLSVVCVNNNCNNNNSKVSTNNDKLSTDILVQVSTSVDGNSKNNVTSNADPDVPVVVGYSGINHQNPSILETANRRLDGRQDVTIQTNPTPGINQANNYNFYHVNKDTGKDGQFQHQIPYFEPSFNNHFFGENQSPNFVWYRRRNNFPSQNNPHAFNVNTRTYKPFNQWHLKYPVTQPPQHTPSGWSPTTQCTCTNPGMNWYPSFGQQQPTLSSSINNKMSPLN